MTDKPTASHSLGLELDPAHLKGAHLSFQHGKPALTQVFEIKVDQEQSSPSNVKLLYMGHEEKKLRSMVQKCLVVTAIPTSEILVRNLEIQLTKERDIDAVLDFQVEPLLPYPIDDSVVDRVTLEKRKESTLLTVLAVRTDHLTQHLKQWHSLDIEPEVISAVPAALASFSGHLYPSEGIHYTLHFGMSETTCVLVNHGKLLAAQGSRIGVRNMMEAFATDAKLTSSEAEQQFYSLDFSSVSENSFPKLYQVVNNLRLEVTKYLYALAKQVKGQEINEILVTGEGSILPNFSEIFCTTLKKTLILPKKQPSFSLTSEKLQKYAIPIGKALTTLPKSEDQVNFRQKEFVYPFPWKRIKKPMATYLALCVFFALALYIFGNAYIANQEDKLKQEYVDVLAFMKKPFQEFEQEYRSSEPLEQQYRAGEVVDVITFTQQDLRKRLNYLEKEIQATPDIFPLLPNTPRVSDVLAWLNTHPHITGNEKAKSLEKPRIKLESLSYKMVKRPEQNKKREKYQVKVEIEFSTPTPRYAREFHDILLIPNDIVDPKGDVKWRAERGKYRASFFLKDRTVYPTTRR